VRVSTEFESFGALYEELEEEELGLDLAPLFSPRQSLGRRFGRREWLEFEESSGAPVFDIECAPCPVKDCRPLLRQAIVEAIRLAKRAADKLEAGSKLAPNDRDPAAQKPIVSCFQQPALRSANSTAFTDFAFFLLSVAFTLGRQPFGDYCLKP